MEIDKNSIVQTVKIQKIKKGKIFSRDVFVLKPAVSSLSKGKDSVIHYAFENGNKFTSKSKIMIKFNSENVDMNTLKKKYHLTLIRKMNSGDYLFSQDGANTLDTINTLIQNESAQITTITPSLVFNVKPM